MKAFHAAPGPCNTTRRTVTGPASGQRCITNGTVTVVGSCDIGRVQFILCSLHAASCLEVSDMFHFLGPEQPKPRWHWGAVGLQRRIANHDRATLSVSNDNRERCFRLSLNQCSHCFEIFKRSMFVRERDRPVDLTAHRTKPDCLA
jgi:hypothetical protein